LNERSKNFRAGLRRQEILAAASDVIRRRGARGVGMRDIARAVGLSPANLYYYFRNKDELVYYCQEQALTQLLDLAVEARAQRGARARLEWLVRGHLRVVLGGGAGLHLDELPAPLYKKLVRLRDQYEDAVRALIFDGQRRGQMRPGDPKLIAFQLLGALNWTARWYRPDGAYTIEAIATSFVDQFLGGIAI
jgi:AcrR family transcriptional regulator